MPMTNKARHEEHRERLFAYVGTALVAVQLAVVLVSWVLKAANPALSVRSLLSSEGVRWFWGQLAHNLATPLLAWLLLWSAAYGSFQQSGIGDLFHRKRPLGYRQRMARKAVAVELLVLVALVAGMTLMPHAMLLSVTGTLFPSSFSSGLVPLAAFVVFLCSATYGLIAGNYKQLPDIFRALSKGLKAASLYTLLYIIGIELFYSICFVLQI